MPIFKMHIRQITEGTIFVEAVNYEAAIDDTRHMIRHTIGFSNNLDNPTVDHAVEVEDDLDETDVAKYDETTPLWRRGWTRYGSMAGIDWPARAHDNEEEETDDDA